MSLTHSPERGGIRVPDLSRRVCGVTQGNMGSIERADFPRSRKGMPTHAADLKWGTGGTRPYRPTDVGQ